MGLDEVWAAEDIMNALKDATGVKNLKHIMREEQNAMAHGREEMVYAEEMKTALLGITWEAMGDADAEGAPGVAEQAKQQDEAERNRGGGAE